MIGQTILHYKILEKLGEGGMGEVFKAQDTKLDRFVALKFLPSQLTASEDDKARFIQEAKAASSMNHPNVCTIHDIQEYNGQLFIVMEYVEGKTLKDKKGSISEKQILEIGIQVAEGLAAAHEKGIVHRDIKPENIMVRKDGIAQIMDFGLAKLYSDSNVSRLTKTGTTMGTVGYMSPEQVQGLDVDHRTDIFSLGVVLYEMLTGESPFKGMHETAIMYEIVNVDAAPLSTIKENIPPELDSIILECLEKEPAERYQSAAEIARNLRRVKRDSGKSKTIRTGVINKSRQFEDDKKTILGKSRKKIILPVSFLLVAILAAVISWFMHPESVKQVRKIQWSTNDDLVVISPDGKKIAGYKGKNIWIRFLDKTDPVKIKSDESVSNIFWSPNSDYLAYFTGFGETETHKLMKVPVSGVGNVLITQTAGNYFPRFWGVDDSILVTTWDKGGKNTLLKVSASGGDLSPICGGDSILSNINGNLTQVLGLPDGRSLILSTNYLNGKNQIILQSDNKRKVIYSHSTDAFIERPVYSNDGFILFPLVTQNGSDLWAIPFDASSLEKTGNNFLIARNASYPSVSENGILIYSMHRNSISNEQLVMVSRTGRLIKQFNISPDHLYNPAVSRDGNKIACTLTEGTAEYNIWMYNVFNNTKVQLTYNIPETWGPSWSPDGKKIVFVSGFGGNQDIYMQEINSTMPARPFLNSKYAEIFPFWTLDGRYILYSRQENDLSSNSDLWYIEPKENNKAQKLFVSPYDEIEPKMSPDDKYVVFISNKSGQYEVWVTNFPEADHLWQISFGGGNYPLWIKDEIFFVNTRTRELMSVKVKPGPEFGVPQKVISADSVGILLNDQNGPKYTMTNDGKNIIAVKASNNETINSEINFVENWSEEFKNKEKAK